MSTPQALGVFLGIPLALFVVVVLLVYAPSWSRGRMRADVTWPAGPVWLGTQATPDEVAAAQPAVEGGGASARW